MEPPHFYGEIHSHSADLEVGGNALESLGVLE